MMIKVHLFFLFGVIVIVNCRLIREYDDVQADRYKSDLQQLLKEMYKQGKLDVKKHNSYHSHNNHEMHDDVHHEHDTNPSLTNIQTLNLYYKKHPRNPNVESESDDEVSRSGDPAVDPLLQTTDRCSGINCDHHRSDKNSVDEVVKMLDELEKDLENRPDTTENGNEKEDINDEISDNRRGDRREDRREDKRGDRKRELRCRGNRCGRGRSRDDRERGDGESLRCRGNRCGRGRSEKGDSADDKEERVDEPGLRCRGNRCGRSRSRSDRGDNLNDREDRVDESGLRCRGNRCGRGRSERGDNPNDREGVNESGLRCGGNRCGRGRNGRDDRPSDDPAGSKNDLRCRGNRCGRGRDGRDDGEGNDLRCRGTRCERGSSDSKLRCRGNDCDSDSSDDDDSGVKELDKHIKKYKISDDLDAIVLDVSDLDKLISKLGKPTKNNLKEVKLLENVDLDSLFGDKKISDENRDLEAIVIDLSQVQNSDVLANKIKNLVSPNEKIFMENRDVINDKLNMQIMDLFKQNQNRVFEVNKLIGDRGSNKVVNNKKGSKILPHVQDNNNVYVPKWLHDAVILNSKLRQSSFEDQQPKDFYSNRLAPISVPAYKSMFPLTHKQKNRVIQKLHRPLKFWHNHVDQNIGVPFEMQVQGLGQVNS